MKGQLSERGIEFRLGRKVTAIELQHDGSLAVELDNGETVVCDLIVHGAGRVPNIDQLDLTSGGVKYNEHGIVVNRFMRSVSNPNVFAAGDCSASEVPRLTPVAIDRQNDKVLGAHLLGPSAEETINLFALAMKFGLTAKDLKSTLFAFPTFTSDVRQML